MLTSQRSFHIAKVIDKTVKLLYTILKSREIEHCQAIVIGIGTDFHDGYDD